MFDIGVNLTSSQFAKDRDDVVARAFAAGVKGMLLTGTNIHESQQALKLARRYPHCWSTAGVHPHDSSQWSPASEDAIIALANQPEVVAIGECRLDFNRNFSTPQEQERAFQAQLQIAAELQMPIFMHCRDAHERFLALLDPWLDSLPGAILHCFTGSRQQMQACVDRGLYIGITGWVCDERRDLTPKPTSRRNEPAYLPHILERIALWRGEDPQWLAAMTDANARTLFEVVF
ncbi:hydrolase TatD [Salmonella enterica]|nr:hydrolase TatD [Salmonella enterica]